jgi:hypothetical protein
MLVLFIGLVPCGRSNVKFKKSFNMNFWVMDAICDGSCQEVVLDYSNEFLVYMQSLNSINFSINLPHFGSWVQYVIIYVERLL